jgi:hypothetical protein
MTYERTHQVSKSCKSQGCNLCVYTTDANWASRSHCARSVNKASESTVPDNRSCFCCIHSIKYRVVHVPEQLLQSYKLYHPLVTPSWMLQQKYTHVLQYQRRHQQLCLAGHIQRTEQFRFLDRALISRTVLDQRRILWNQSASAVISRPALLFGRYEQLSPIYKEQAI